MQQGKRQQRGKNVWQDFLKDNTKDEIIRAQQGERQKRSQINFLKNAWQTKTSVIQ